MAVVVRMRYKPTGREALLYSVDAREAFATGEWEPVSPEGSAIAFNPPASPMDPAVLGAGENTLRDPAEDAGLRPPVTHIGSSTNPAVVGGLIDGTPQPGMRGGPGSPMGNPASASDAHASDVAASLPAPSPPPAPEGQAHQAVPTTEAVAAKVEARALAAAAEAAPKPEATGGPLD